MQPLRAAGMRHAVVLASLLAVAAAQGPPGPTYNPLAPGTATVHDGVELLAALHANKGNISLEGELSRVRAGLAGAQVAGDAPATAL